MGRGVAPGGSRKLELCARVLDGWGPWELCLSIKLSGWVQEGGRLPSKAASEAPPEEASVFWEGGELCKCNEHESNRVQTS